MKLQSKITLMIIIFLSFIFSVFSCGYAWINNDQSLLFIILVILVHMAVLFSVFNFLEMKYQINIFSALQNNCTILRYKGENIYLLTIIVFLIINTIYNFFINSVTFTLGPFYQFVIFASSMLLFIKRNYLIISNKYINIKGDIVDAKSINNYYFNSNILTIETSIKKYSIKLSKENTKKIVDAIKQCSIFI